MLPRTLTRMVKRMTQSVTCVERRRRTRGTHSARGFPYDEASRAHGCALESRKHSTPVRLVPFVISYPQTRLTPH
jgi:hypothetical protein